MGVSQEFRNLEDRVGSACVVQDDLVGGIARKLNQEKVIIERVLYRACVAVGSRPFELAFIVNEFWAALQEEISPVEEEVTNERGADDE